MKNLKSLLAALLAVCMVATLLVGTVSAENGLDYAQGTTLRMATGYNNAKTGLFFNAEVAGEGITLADGVTYHSGDLKPTWVEVQNVLGVTFEDKYQGNSAAKEFEYWKDRLSEVDMVSGTAVLLSEYGETGALVNIAEYLDKMPNFAKRYEAQLDRWRHYGRRPVPVQ